MRGRPGVVLGVTLLAIVSTVAGSVTAGTAGRCCYTNTRYAGVCEVAPAADETCSTVLAYLNNPASAGKGYCGGTAVRGGWTQVTCKDPSPATTPAAGRGTAPAGETTNRR